MRKIFYFIDTILAKFLYLILDSIAYVTYLFLLIKSKIFKKKTPVTDLYRYLDINNSKDGTGTTFTMNSRYDIGSIPFPPASRMPVLDFDEVEEFEKTKKYLTNKAKELGGRMNWYESPDGLCVYTFEFEDDVSLQKFEDILINTATFGIPVFEETKKIDDDINDMLSEIENGNK